MSPPVDRKLAYVSIAFGIGIVVACSSSDDSALSVASDDGGDSETQVGPTPDSAAPASDASTKSDAQTTPDASPAGGCAGKTYKICEDFESSTVGNTPIGWTELDLFAADTAPKTVVASDVVHSGSHSLKTSSNVSGAHRVQKSLAGLGGATAGTHWGRVFYQVQSPPPHLASQGPHATFVALQGNLRANELRVVDTQQFSDGKIQLLANTPDDACCTQTGNDYTVWDGKWHCAEWYVDQATQSYRFFLDEKEITALAFDYGAGSTMAHMPTAFTSVGLGTIFYTPTLPSNLVTWFDDLAIDDAQIGCN